MPPGLGARVLVRLSLRVTLRLWVSRLLRIPLLALLRITPRVRLRGMTGSGVRLRGLAGLVVRLVSVPLSRRTWLRRVLLGGLGIGPQVRILLPASTTWSSVFSPAGHHL